MGYAIQCRITSEDPELNFQPDSGRIQAYRCALHFSSECMQRQEAYFLPSKVVYRLFRDS